jgi:aminopeptidase N
MRRLVPLLAILGLAAMPAAADTYPRQPGLDALHYAFRVDLSDDSDEIMGAATVEFRFVAEGVKSCTLDLATAKDGKGMTVLDVTSGSTSIPFEHRDDRLRLTLDPAPKAGERRKFTVRYRGVPASGLEIGKNKYGERTFFSDNWPDHAHQWLPVIDHPYDKATSEFHVTAPARYQVIANGLLVEETDLGDGRRLTHWKQSVPIAVWLNALGVAQFAVHHAGMVKGVPLETWVFHQDRDLGILALEEPARRALEFYSDRIGPFSYEKLGNVQAAGVDGAMELATAIFYGQGLIGQRPPTHIVAHEVAHQWFGDAVTERDWDDVWLSEGFATYCALLYTEHYEGRDAFVAGLKRAREIVFAFEKRQPGLAIIHENISDMRRILSPLVYEKAGWFLHMLRGRVGTETFWAGLRDYYRRYRDGNASTDDFRRVIEENSGQDLAAFFRQWLNRPGSPSLEGTWRYDMDSRKIIIELNQNQRAEPYRLPIEIGLEVQGRPSLRIEKIELSERQQRFEIEAESEPASVVLDPNVWTLMESRFSKK